MSAFDWYKYISVAEILKDFATEESSRAGISRSYYAAFGKTKIFCLNNSIVKSAEAQQNKNKIHQFIITKLLDSDHEDLYLLGQHMQTLRNRRNDADYNAECIESGKVSLLVNSISLAKEVIVLIKDYNP